MIRPSWQQDPCPDWCVIDHQEHDPDDDRAHRDGGMDIPIVVRKREIGDDGSVVAHLESGYVTMGRWQRVGDEEVWICVGDNEGQELEFNRDSFHRVIAMMHGLSFETENLQAYDAA